MARPRLTEGAIERLQLVIPSEEIASIEKWRFANEIASKSEAVRRLCQIGLAFDQEHREAKDRTRSALDATTRGIRMLIERSALVGDGNSIELRQIAGVLLEAMEAQLSLYQDMVSTDATAAAMARSGDVDEHVREAATIREKLTGGYYP